MLIQNFNTSKKIFLIAEIGNNHEGNLNLAKKLIYLAKKNGADAVKFQYINPKNLVNRKIYPERVNFLEKVCLKYSDFIKLKKYAQKLKIFFLCSIFDYNKIKNFSKILPAFKIASGENNFIPNILNLAKFRKPILISTGMLTNKEIDRLMEKLSKNKNITNKICLLHCVSNYPVLIKDANLSKIQYLKKYKVQIGYSDHTLGINACLVAASLGARIIEKHFTIDHNYSKFRDHQLSMNPEQLKLLSRSLKEINILLGKNEDKISYAEKLNIKNSRRGIYAKYTLKKNQKIKKDDLLILRPEGNISVDKINKIIGSKTKKEIKELTEINFQNTYQY